MALSSCLWVRTGSIWIEGGIELWFSYNKGFWWFHGELWSSDGSAELSFLEARGKGFYTPTSASQWIRAACKEEERDSAVNRQQPTIPASGGVRASVLKGVWAVQYSSHNSKHPCPGPPWSMTHIRQQVTRCETPSRLSWKNSLDFTLFKNPRPCLKIFKDFLKMF